MITIGKIAKPAISLLDTIFAQPAAPTRKPHAWKMIEWRKQMARAIAGRRKNGVGRPPSAAVKAARA